MAQVIYLYRAIPCAMTQTLYHDGACTCSTCANLWQKVGLQGREMYWPELHEVRDPNMPGTND